MEYGFCSRFSQLLGVWPWLPLGSGEFIPIGGNGLNLRRYISLFKLPWITEKWGILASTNTHPEFPVDKSRDARSSAKISGELLSMEHLFIVFLQ